MYFLYIRKAAAGHTLAPLVLPGRIDGAASNCIQEANNLLESPLETVPMVHLGKHPKSL